MILNTPPIWVDGYEGDEDSQYDWEECYDLGDGEESMDEDE
jgi:hypothetical protein